MSAPLEFPGTAEEVAENRATHDFDYVSGRCDYCDCRPWGTASQWTCGADVPRTSDPQAVASAVARIAGVEQPVIADYEDQVDGVLDRIRDEIKGDDGWPSFPFEFAKRGYGGYEVSLYGLDLGWVVKDSGGARWSFYTALNETAYGVEIDEASTRLRACEYAAHSLSSIRETRYDFVAVKVARQASETVWLEL
jgi:hypothetical protein